MSITPSLDPKLGGRYAHLAGAWNQLSGAVASGQRPRGARS
jgi:hypothetical protein